MLTYVRESRGDRLGDALRADGAELAHRHDAIPVADRVADFRLGAAKAADSHLRKAQHVPHWSDVAKRVNVGEAQIVDERRVVDMRVEVDNVQRLRVLVSP